MDISPSTLLERASSIGAVALGAWLATLFGVKRTKAERLWNAKYEAWQKLLAAADDLYFWAGELVNDAYQLPGNASLSHNERTMQFHNALRTLGSYTITGAIVISDRAREQLRSLNADIADERFRYYGLQKETDSYLPAMHDPDHAHRMMALLNVHIPKLEELARVDLR